MSREEEESLECFLCSDLGNHCDCHAIGTY